MNSLISVIVPVYNVKDYIEICVNSILSQTHKNLEVILVDDGSTDGSSDLCDYYKKLDNRISVVHKRNGGLSSARNTGLNISKGKFIYFIDSDDWMEHNMLEHLLNKLIVNNADVSTCGFYYSYKGKEKLATPQFDEYILEDATDIFYRMLPFSSNSIRFMVWNKLFKKDLLENIRFVEGQIYEDLNFQRNVMQRVKRIIATSTPLYHYRQCRPGNTISTFKIQKLVKFSELDKYIEMLKERNEKEYTNAYERYALDSAIEIYANACMLNQKKDIRKTLLNIFENYYNRGISVNLRQNIKYHLFHYFPNLYVLLL